MPATFLLVIPRRCLCQKMRWSPIPVKTQVQGYNFYVDVPFILFRLVECIVKEKEGIALRISDICFHVPFHCMLPSETVFMSGEGIYDVTKKKTIIYFCIFFVS